MLRITFVVTVVVICPLTVQNGLDFFSAEVTAKLQSFFLAFRPQTLPLNLFNFLLRDKIYFTYREAELSYRIVINDIFHFIM